MFKDGGIEQSTTVLEDLQRARRAARALTDRRRSLGRAGLSDASQSEQLVAGSRLAAGGDPQMPYVGTSMYQPCGLHTSSLDLLKLARIC